MTNPRTMAADIERALRAAGGSEALRKTLDARERSRRYLSSHYSELLALYPEHWIAVHEQEIVAAELSLDDLARALAKQHLPISEVLLEHMTAHPAINFV